MDMGSPLFAKQFVVPSLMTAITSLTAKESVLTEFQSIVKC
ncbi:MULTISPECIES: hypothetical protein [Vibrio]|nr:MULTISPECIES: hypothetical protein [Vibrio]